jgi:NADH:ubiquinone oxidoreductase subunit 4 (subunit M)
VEIQGGVQTTYRFCIAPEFSFSLRFGVDGISIFFIILTNIFIYFCILSLTTATPKLSEALIHLFFLQ